MRDILYFREGMLVSYVGVTVQLSVRLFDRNVLTCVFSVRMVVLL